MGSLCRSFLSGSFVLAQEKLFGIRPAQMKKLKKESGASTGNRVNVCRGVSVADPGYPGSDFFLSGIRPFSIPDPHCFHPGSASKNLSILTQKNGF
jgi:hypothetical protein